MKLVENWKRVVSISLSFWMQVIGLLILIIPEAWYAASSSRGILSGGNGCASSPWRSSGSRSPLS